MKGLHVVDLKKKGFLCIESAKYVFITSEEVATAWKVVECDNFEKPVFPLHLKKIQHFKLKLWR